MIVTQSPPVAMEEYHPTRAQVLPRHANGQVDLAVPIDVGSGERRPEIVARLARPRHVRRVLRDLERRGQPAAGRLIHVQPPVLLAVPVAGPRLRQHNIIAAATDEVPDLDVADSAGGLFGRRHTTRRGLNLRCTP